MFTFFKEHINAILFLIKHNAISRKRKNVSGMHTQRSLRMFVALVENSRLT